MKVSKNLKNILVILIIFSIILPWNIISYATNETEENIAKNQENKEEYYKIDEQNKFISLVGPETDLATFKFALFGDEDAKNKIYEGKDKTKEVTNGIIKTGMIVDYNNKDYTISVLGDIDKDGRLTETDLKLIINHIVGLEKYQLSGIEEISADISMDGLVDQRDITKAIRYIKYGKLDLKKIVLKEKDITPPEITLDGESEFSTITVNADAVDTESGIDPNEKYIYYIKKASEPDTAYIEKGRTTDKEFTFEQLEQKTQYTIKVEISDRKGNKGEQITSIETKEIPGGDEAGAIKFTSIKWENEKAEVGIETETDYKIEYQVNGTSAGNWKLLENGKVGNLNHNDVVYARLTNGKDFGKYISIKIIDSNKPDLNLSLNAIPASDTQTDNIIEATASATDNESGVASDAKYSFLIKETGNSDSSYVEKQNTTSKNCRFTGLAEGKNYTIRVSTYDRAGNITIKEESILIPDNVAPIVTLEKIDVTTKTLKVKAGATDVGGLPDPVIYVFSIKKTGEEDSSYVEVQNSENNICEVRDLQANTNYTVRVQVADLSNNIGVKELSILTDKIPDANQAGTIYFGQVNWQNGKASTRINTSTNYQIEYKINDGGQWIKTTEGARQVKVDNLNNKDKIIARLTDGINYSDEKSIVIEDNINPQVSIAVKNKNTSSINVEVSSIDNETGIDSAEKYIYYIKKDGNYVKVQETTENIYTFDGLEQNKTYNIKVEIKDKANNVGMNEISCQTGAIPDGNSTGAIVFDNFGWENQKAHINISTTTGLKIEYRVNDGKWTNSGATSVTVNNLIHEDKVQARLTDGISSGSFAEYEVKDIIKPQEFTIKVTDIKTASIKVSGTTEDEQTGLKDYTYIAEANDGTQVKKEHITNTEYTIVGLKQGTTYNVYMIAYDNVGNERKSTTTTINTNEIPGAREGALAFKEIVWKDGKASTTITTTDSEFTIEYQINSTSGNWTKASSAGAEVKLDNLSNGDKVYARLTDGTSSGRYATLNVIDNIAPTGNITTDKTQVKPEESFVATITATDNETRINLENCKYILNKSDSNLGTDESKYTDGNLQSDGKATITVGQEENSYYLHVLLIDNAGNKTEIISKKIEVSIVQFNYTATGMVEYDAGDWTKEEIEQLKADNLYILNIGFSDPVKNNNYKFEDFTYKGDEANLAAITSGYIATSRNKNIWKLNSNGQRYAKAKPSDGWEVFEWGETIGNKRYVKSIVHAGIPERFALYGEDDKYAYKAEYILSSGTRQQEYNTYKPRSFDMYKDVNKLNMIEEVHAMTFDDLNRVEATITEGVSWKDSRIMDGSYVTYWTCQAEDRIVERKAFVNGRWTTYYNYEYILRTNDTGFNSGILYIHVMNPTPGGVRISQSSEEFGIRPVVTLKSGVYVDTSKHTGTGSDKYVLEMDE